MRNRQPDMVQAHIQRAVVLFRYVGAAGVPRRGPLQDQGDDLLWVVRALQAPVNGVGEAHDLPRGLVGCPLWPLLFRRLAGDLIQQGFVPQGDDSAALDAFQVQGIAPAVRPPIRWRAAPQAEQRRRLTNLRAGRSALGVCFAVFSRMRLWTQWKVSPSKMAG